MRIKNSIKNIYICMLSQIIMVLLGFISRKIFIDSLGAEYLGVNGLLSNILSMLSLAEGGIGVSIVYNLYKPLADKDEPKIIALVQLYKKLYGFIGIFVLILSFCLYPFLGIVMKGVKGVPYMGLVYFIFVIKNVISYINAHKWSLINADQKGYILSTYNLIFDVTIIIVKIIVLKETKSYILFLLSEIFIIILKNIWNGRIVNTRYSYIKTKDKYTIDDEIRTNLITNVKALFLHNIGAYCVLGTDNLLIGGFINITTVGLYSNYNMIMSQLHGLISPILGGIGSSVGNLIAVDSKDKSYQIFNIVYLINFWLYSVTVIFLFNCLEPFINLWLGQGLLLDKLTFIFLLINFYLVGLRSSVLTFKSKAGIFKQDKYITLIVAFINLLSSVVLVKYFGLSGIFMGTTISTICIPLWNQPKLVYNIVFDKSLAEYLRKYFLYIGLTIIAGAITTLLCNCIVVVDGWMSLIIKGVISLTIPNIIYIFRFYKSDEFKYIYNTINLVLKKSVHKIA